MAGAETNIPIDANGESVELEAPEVFTDQTTYLNSIHPRFLSHGLPMESGLVDHLRAGGVIDSEDEEDIRAQTSVKGEARKCWTLLTRVTAEKFASVCVPALELRCGLVVEGKVFCWDPCRRVDVDKCLHHVLKKMVPVRKFADLFPGIGGCSHEEYGIMLGGTDHDNSLWELAFSLCQRNKGKVDFFRKALTKIGVPVPEDLKALLATGIPCSCPERENQQTVDISKKRSLSDSRSGSSRAGLNSHVSCGERGGERPEMEEEEDCCFESPEQKETFMTQLEVLNKTISKVCSIKAVFYEVTGIHMELLALRHPAQVSDCETNGVVVLLDKSKTLRLQFYVVKLRQNMKDYEAAVRVAKETDSVNRDAKIPDKFKSDLMDRRGILVRELNDVEAFYNKSRDFFKQLGLDCCDQLKSVKKARGGQGRGCESRGWGIV